MLHLPADLSNIRILISNDDGIDAPGIAVLEKVARQFSSDVWVVAPETEQSGAGHSLTLHEPLRVTKRKGKRYAVSGTPTDCVLLAVKEIIPRRKKVGLVLSGINRGMNIAEDVTYSGTIAAAMEGTLLDIPSIAVSQALHENEPVAWDTAAYYLEQVLRQLPGLQWQAGSLISVNVPHGRIDEVRGIHVAGQGRRKIAEKLDARIDPKGRPYYWIGGTGFEKQQDVPGIDHTLLKEGYVTVTPLSMDLTNHAMLATMKTHMAGPD